MDKMRKNLTNLIVILLIVSLTILGKYTIVEASTTIEPDENQYFELKATELKELENQSKQVIMELWGYNINFKRIRC